LVKKTKKGEKKGRCRDRVKNQRITMRKQKGEKKKKPQIEGE